MRLAPPKTQRHQIIDTPFPSFSYYLLRARGRGQLDQLAAVACGCARGAGFGRVRVAVATRADAERARDRLARAGLTPPATKVRGFCRSFGGDAPRSGERTLPVSRAPRSPPSKTQVLLFDDAATRQAPGFLPYDALRWAQERLFRRRPRARRRLRGGGERAPRPDAEFDPRADHEADAWASLPDPLVCVAVVVARGSSPPRPSCARVL